jgi:hypothetical protein
MHIESAVTAATELATQHSTVVEKILLVTIVLVLLEMVSRAWDVMLSTKFAPQRVSVKHQGTRRREKTKPPARKKK